jgi:hypothetical protein
MVKKGLTINDKVVFIVLLLLMLVPLFWLSFYNHPAADDYVITVTAWQKGFFGAQKYWYNNWTGRYFSFATMSFTPLFFGAYWAYKLNTLLYLIIMLTVAYWLSNLLFKNLGRQIMLTISAAFLFVHFIAMPDIAQGLFWQSGLYACYLGIILSLLLFGCVVKFYRTKNYIFLILACILCAAIIGSYEFFMAITDLLALLLFAHFLSKRRFDFPAFVIVLVCIICSIVVIMAPGNAVRNGLLPHRHQFWFSIFKASEYGVYYMLNWALFVVPVLIIIYDHIDKKLPNHPGSIFQIPPIYPILFGFFASIIGMFIGFWSLGERPPLRAINLLFFYFLVSSIYFLICLVNYIRNKGYNFKISATIKMGAYLFLLILIAFKPNNFTNAYKDMFSGNAQKFDEQMMARRNYLLQSKADTCTVERIKNIPKTLYFIEPPSDTTDLEYKAFCSFYNKKRITIK